MLRMFFGNGPLTVCRGGDDMTVQQVIETTLFSAGVVGFAFGTGVYLFAWMVRQPYRLFRRITGSDVAS